MCHTLPSSPLCDSRPFLPICHTRHICHEQEAIYFALFQEVSEAKSLLEQTTLVCQGRPFYQAKPPKERLPHRLPHPDMYTPCLIYATRRVSRSHQPFSMSRPMVSTLLSFVFLMQSVLQYIKNYVKFDLRRLDIPPAKLLSRKPMDDPLESIMYITSVGVPSVIYETVKNLRQARGYRLGAMQRKFPFLGIGLLYLLAAVELLATMVADAGDLASARRCSGMDMSEHTAPRKRKGVMVAWWRSEAPQMRVALGGERGCAVKLRLARGLNH